MLSSRSSQPKDWTHISCLTGRFFPTELLEKPCLSYNFSLLHFESFHSSWLLLLLPWFSPGWLLIGSYQHLLLHDRSLSISVLPSPGHVSLLLSALTSTFPWILMAFGVKANPGTLWWGSGSSLIPTSCGFAYRKTMMRSSGFTDFKPN